MARRTIKADFTIKGIRQLKKELEQYKAEINAKCMVLVEKLAQEGITVAQGNTGNYGKYIAFSIQTDAYADGCKAVLYATNTGIIQSEWQTKDGIKTADVNPLLMVEFGSGQNAQNPLNIAGVGQGTFPGQTHAFDKNGWWYMDIEGQWHHSKGVTPKMPMYKAQKHIHERVVAVAKEVFRS